MLSRNLDSNRKLLFSFVILLSALFTFAASTAAYADSRKVRRGVAVGVAVGVGIGIILSNQKKAKSANRGQRSRSGRPRKGTRKYTRSRSSTAKRSRTAASAPRFSPEVLATQKSLNLAGYDAGAEDGLTGRQTREAIKNFQRDEGFPATGTLTADQRERLYAVSVPEGKRSLSAGRDEDGAATPINERTSTTNLPGATETRKTPPAQNAGHQAAVTPDAQDRDSAAKTDQAPTQAAVGKSDAAGTAGTDPSARGRQFEIEEMLVKLQLLDESELDGKHNELTKEAIKGFQTYLGHEPTGVLTDDELAKLKQFNEMGSTG